MNHVRTKIQLYTTWIQKKSKLLPSSSDLLLRAEGSLALLLSHMEPSEQVLHKREELIRHRIQALDMVDDKSMSRLKGFELFKLYLILRDKLQLLRKSVEEQELDKLVLEKELALVEAKYLLEGDAMAPEQIFRTIEDLENSVQMDIMVREKYK